MSITILTNSNSLAGKVELEHPIDSRALTDIIEKLKFIRNAVMLAEVKGYKVNHEGGILLDSSYRSGPFPNENGEEFTISSSLVIRITK